MCFSQSLFSSRALTARRYSPSVTGRRATSPRKVAAIPLVTTHGSSARSATLTEHGATRIPELLRRLRRSGKTHPGEPRPGGWQPPTCGALSAVGAETTSPPKPTAPAAPAARLHGLPGRQPLRRGVVLLEDAGLCAGAALPGAWGRKGCKPRRERQTVPMSGTEQGAAAPPARHMVALQPALYPGRWAFLHRRSR